MPCDPPTEAQEAVRSVPGWFPHEIDMGCSPTWAQYTTLAYGPGLDVVVGPDDQDVLAEVGGGCAPNGTRVRLATALLKREPDNPRDLEAVTVTFHGEPAGHIPFGRTCPFHRVIEEALHQYAEPATCRVELTGGIDTGGGRAPIGLRLLTGDTPRRFDDTDPVMPPGDLHAKVNLLPGVDWVLESLLAGEESRTVTAEVAHGAGGDLTVTVESQEVGTVPGEHPRILHVVRAFGEIQSRLTVHATVERARDGPAVSFTMFDPEPGIGEDEVES